MVKIISVWLDLQYFNDLARRHSFFHHLHPVGKVVITLVFVITATSFDKYEIAGLLPLFFYPIVAMAAGGVPYRRLVKRLLLVSPFVLLVGLFNPLFDRTPHDIAGFFTLSGGWLSFISITIKLFLTTLAALILIATTSLPEIGAALRQFGFPRPLVVQLLLLHRYLYVLLEEVGRITQACELRSAPGKGLPYGAWGSLLGQLLLRTVARAQRIYQAMLCRGFSGEFRLLTPRPLQTADYWQLFVWCGFFLICRFVNLPQLPRCFFLEVL